MFDVFGKNIVLVINRGQRCQDSIQLFSCMICIKYKTIQYNTEKKALYKKNMYLQGISGHFYTLV